MTTKHIIDWIKIALRRTCQLILSLFILFLLFINYRLYYHPSFSALAGAQTNIDLYRQLKFLEKRMHQGEGQKMQELFPEGYIFLNVLYGLSWCNLLTNVPDTTNLYREGLTEIDWAYREVDAPQGKNVFYENLPLEYGAFYTGWSTYLLASKLSLEKAHNRTVQQEEAFQRNCSLIAKALKRSETPFLESYPAQAWPADMFPCMLSLKIHDALYDPEYTADIQTWSANIKHYLDPVTGLIPHAVEAGSGAPLEGSRGSSQCLMLNLLIDIDSVFGRAQYEVFKTRFIDRRLGLPAVREYPVGSEGEGDVDSGPVLLGIGGAASIVGQRTAGKYGDWTLYENLRNCIELLGCPYTNDSGKQYLFGKLPIADAFIAWSNSIEHSPSVIGERSNWRWQFQWLSLVVVGVALFIMVRLGIR